MTTPRPPEPTAGTDRTIEAKPPRLPVSKASALRRALAQLEQARRIAAELADESKPGGAGRMTACATPAARPVRADPRDAWRHTGEPPPPEIVRNSDISGKLANTPQPYRTPQATVDAFFHVARTEDTDGILKWLARHPRDAQHLHKLWKRKCSTAAL
jgi:hypothetical protein